MLTPVDKNGKKLTCEMGKCENTDFDWTWTQHTAFRIDEKSDKRFVYVTAFDNGDGRGLEQPPLPDMKYSRAVVFKIDQQKKTVEQVWEYGKEKGHDWYSPVTSLTQYEGDKDSVMVYSATPQMQLVAGKVGHGLNRVNAPRRSIDVLRGAAPGGVLKSGVGLSRLGSSGLHAQCGDSACCGCGAEERTAGDIFHDGSSLPLAAPPRVACQGREYKPNDENVPAQMCNARAIVQAGCCRFESGYSSMRRRSSSPSPSSAIFNATASV